MEKVRVLLLIFMYLFSSNPLLLSSTKFVVAFYVGGNETDHMALLAFKHQITNDPLSSWNDSTHYCNWEGITCSPKHPERVTTLDLGYRNLVGSISPSIGNLTFLRTILLNSNGFYGEIPPSIGRLHRLQLLNLSDNSFQGPIPVNLTRCSDLRIIDFSINQLTGGIPVQLSSLLKLDNLLLYQNGITGVIPPSLGNLSSLTHLSFLRNNLEGSIPEDLGRLAKLKFFQVSGNMVSGMIPPSIYNLSSLYYLALASNQLNGSIPANIGNTLPNLRTLLLGANQFQGPIPPSLSNASGLVLLDVAYNEFTGLMPFDLGRLNSLVQLNLAHNQLEANDAKDWEFLTSLTNCSRLEILYLEGNKLGGILPNSVANFTTQLQVLLLDENQISGIIPPGIENLINLNILGLYNNLFIGTIPEGIGKLKRMQKMGLSGNMLKGQIPNSLGNLTQLIYLYLQDNNLEGPIPTSLGNLQHLVVLDLSNNSLNGTIPKEIVSLSSLSDYLSLSNNFLVGSLPSEVGSLKNLKELAVSGNKMSGEIPGTLANCQILEILLLENNQFQGNIPPSLSNIKGLQVLDLSRNNLSGTIPQLLENLSNLYYLNLSFNHLEGVVPTKGVFQNATAISLRGNSGLCGGITPLQLPACLIKTSKRRGLSLLLLKVLIPIGIASLFLTLLSSYFLFLHRKRKSREGALAKPSMDQDSYPKVSYAELVKGTDGFSSNNVIGMGRYGTVYKGTLDHGNTTVAVKVFNLQQRGASKSFIAECNALRSIRHRNLIKILTSCSSIDYKGNDFKALVFEFMPNGSLETWLHPELDGHHQLNNLSLIQRLGISIDVADALDYLHHNCQPPVIHCDLKPSNILLDHDMTAHVGDFGLAKLLSITMSKSLQDLSSSIGIRGSIGYVPPEYGAGGQVSTSGDVYSYGILLLEMLTGKRPVDDIFKDGLSLPTFVEMAFPDRVMEISDQEVLLQEEEEDIPNINLINSKARSRIHECLVSMARVGLACSKKSLRERMNMKDVATEMHGIRDVYLGVGFH